MPSPSNLPRRYLQGFRESDRRSHPSRVWATWPGSLQDLCPRDSGHELCVLLPIGTRHIAEAVDIRTEPRRRYRNEVCRTIIVDAESYTGDASSLETELERHLSRMQFPLSPGTRAEVYALPLARRGRGEGARMDARARPHRREAHREGGGSANDAECASQRFTGRPASYLLLGDMVRRVSSATTQGPRRVGPTRARAVHQRLANPAPKKSWRTGARRARRSVL